MLKAEMKIVQLLRLMLRSFCLPASPRGVGLGKQCLGKPLLDQCSVFVFAFVFVCTLCYQVKLPSSAFRNSRSLRRLNLNSNQVSFIQRQSFQGLQRLHRFEKSVYLRFTCVGVCVCFHNIKTSQYSKFAFFFQLGLTKIC